MEIQGRQLRKQEIAWIRELIQRHPEWHRTRLSRELCKAWEWTNDKGELKDMACRTMLLKLDRMGIIQLPAPRSVGVGNARKQIPQVSHDTTPIIDSLRELTPLTFEIVRTSATRALFQHLLASYHYLGFSGTVGQNMPYLIRDRHGRTLACLLFGSAAWKTAPRDEWIGWTAAVRRQSLPLVTNNMRFLILPWVQVPHLASHILGRIARRIRQDWLEKYGHPVYLLETFVEQGRFRGTCYQAANWVRLGQTQGRSRNDTYQTLKVPIKDIYVYPLISHVQEVLAHET
jgi:hypothetical protein